MNYELEQLRRSIAMLAPGARAFDREGALRVLADLQRAQRERDELRAKPKTSLQREATARS